MLYKASPNLRAKDLSKFGLYFLEYRCRILRNSEYSSVFPSDAFFNVPEDNLREISFNNGIVGKSPRQNNNAQVIYYNDKSGRIEALRAEGGASTIQLYESSTAFNPSDLKG